VKIFERQVLNNLEKSVRRWAFKSGAFVKKVMQNSIKKRGDVSEPGQPPHSHKGQLKKFIRFAVEASQGRVIIGPKKLKRKVGAQPHALEFGGKTTARRKRKKRESRVKARPFALPALKKSTTKTTRMWKDAIRKI
jgi:hypothetical protein